MDADPTPEPDLRSQLRRRRRRARRRWSSFLALSLLLIIILTVSAWFYLRAPLLEVGSARISFSPNGDGAQDTASFSYTLMAGAQVSARMLDAAGAPVQTLLDRQALPAGAHLLVWDGLRSTGEIPPEGSYRLELQAVQLLRRQTARVEISLDTTPPAVLLTNLPESGVFSQAVVNLQGITEAGVNLASLETAALSPLGAAGQFSLQLNLQEGQNLLLLTARDPAGNQSVLQREITFTPLPTGLVLNSPADNLWTNKPVIQVEGKLPSGTRLRLFDQEIIASADGVFATALTLQEGSSLLEFTLVRASGEEVSFARSVQLKSQPASLTVNLGENQETDLSLYPLSGRTDPGLALMINGQSLTAGVDGSFALDLPLRGGVNPVEITVTDLTGSRTALSRQLTYLPPAPLEALKTWLAGAWKQPPLQIGVALAVLLMFLWGMRLLRKKPVKIEIELDEQVFFPAVPGEKNLLGIGISLSEPAVVQVEIYDEHLRRVRSFTGEQKKLQTKLDLIWDGLDQGRQVVPPGHYLIQAAVGSFPGRSVQAVTVEVSDRITSADAAFSEVPVLPASYSQTEITSDSAGAAGATESSEEGVPPDDEWSAPPDAAA